MSKQSKFTADELNTLSLWKTPDFFNGDATASSNESKSKRTSMLTVTEIESMQKQAYDEAFAQGHKEGRAKGYEEGYTEGIALGKLKGHEEGLQQGQAAAKTQQREQMEEFASLMAALSEPFKQLDETVEKQLVALTIAIASQLVRREIKQHPGEIMAVVRAAVAVLPVAVQKLTLFLHPVDAEMVRSSLALTDAVTSWQIIEDPLLTQGGCKVTTDVSLVDATVEKRLVSVIAMVLGDEREPTHERS